MDTINIKKRKKRKTRKCLDELRNKTRQANDVCRIYKHTDSKVGKNKSNCMKNNYITSNRLTLFNKAIRSETVTRLQLAELENKKLNLNTYRETVNSKYTNNSDTEGHNNEIVRKEDIHIIENRKSGTEEIPLPNKSEITLCNDVDTPNSIPLFSPGSQNKEISAKSNSPFEISLSSSSTPTFNTIEPEPDLYSHIVEGIELYLTQNYPHIIKSMDKKMEKSKAKLLSFFTKKVTFNSDTTGDTTPSNHYSSPEGRCSSPNVPIIQNPRNYIAHSLVQHSAESRTSGIQVSSPSGSSTSVSIHISSPSPLFATDYDTPEYHYYPHRLN